MGAIDREYIIHVFGEGFGIEELLFLWLCSFIRNSNKVLFAFCYLLFSSIYWYLVCTSLAVSKRFISSKNVVDRTVSHITWQKGRTALTELQNTSGIGARDYDPKDDVLWLPLPLRTQLLPVRIYTRIPFLLTTFFASLFCLRQKNMFSTWKYVKTTFFRLP
jgi:hypothetical protein